MDNAVRLESPLTGQSGWRKLSLFSQMILIITTLIALIVLSLSYLTIQRQRESNIREIRRSVFSRLDTLEAASIDALFLSDVDVLDSIGDRMEDSPDVISVVFFDVTGRVIAVSGDTHLRGFLGLLDIPPDGLQLLDDDSTNFVESDEKVTAGISVQAGRRDIGAILIEVSTIEFTQSLQATQQQSIIISLVALASGIVVAFFISRFLVKPLQDLAQVTGAIAKGQLDQPVNLQTTSLEMGQVISSFDFMRSELKTLYGGLENQVEIRTAELAESNANLTQTNQQLDIAQKESNEANRLKSEFLSTMSHELRTPLNAILGYSGLFAMGIYGKLDDTQLEKIKAMEESGKHLLSLINDVLDISKIEAGRMKLISEPILLNDIKEHLVARISVLAQDKGIDFKHQLDANLPDEVLGDGERLTRIATNLLSNAVKFTDEGEVNLEIRLKANDKTMWQMIVKDTGMGIPPDALEYIFDEFRQVDGSYSRSHEGTGLGLAITQKLVQAMKGQIKVESELGKGSQFTVTLPLETEIQMTSEVEISYE